MKRCYIIEMGGDKEVDEMLALELNDIDDARIWIKEAMESDSKYFNCNIKCNIIDLKYEQYNSTTNFYYKGLVYIDTDDIFNIELIIETNLSIISKITNKMIETKYEA